MTFKHIIIVSVLTLNCYPNDLHGFQNIESLKAFEHSKQSLKFDKEYYGWSDNSTVFIKRKNLLNETKIILQNGKTYKKPKVYSHLDKKSIDENATIYLYKNKWVSVKKGYGKDYYYIHDELWNTMKRQNYVPMKDEVGYTNIIDLEKYCDYNQTNRPKEIIEKDGKVLNVRGYHINKKLELISSMWEDKNNKLLMTSCVNRGHFINNDNPKDFQIQIEVMK